MYTNLYLVEKLDHQRRQEFINQAAQDHVAAQLPDTDRSVAKYIPPDIRRRLLKLHCWLANRTQSEQLAR